MTYTTPSISWPHFNFTLTLCTYLVYLLNLLDHIHTLVTVLRNYMMSTTMHTHYTSYYDIHYCIIATCSYSYSGHTHSCYCLLLLHMFSSYLLTSTRSNTSTSSWILTLTNIITMLITSSTSCCTSHHHYQDTYTTCLTS